MKNLRKEKNKMRIAILGGSTTKLIKDNLEALLKKKNFEPKFYESDYNQFYFEGIQPPKKLKKFKPNLIYIHTSSINIDEFPKIEFKLKESEDLLEKTFNKYKSIWTNLSKNFDCNIIQNNFEMLSLTSLGNLDSSKHYGKINFLTKLNLKFFDYANKVNNLIIQDISHANQEATGKDENNNMITKGNNNFIFPIARAAVAVGVDGLFIETHENSNVALSDNDTQIDIDDLKLLLDELIDIANVTKGGRRELQM